MKPKKIPHSALLLSFTLLIPLQLSGQSADSLAPSQLIDTLGTVTVESTHGHQNIDEATQATTIYPADQVSDEPSANSAISDVLQATPGITAQNRHNLALGERIMIRGMGWRSAFGIRGIQMLYDGIPLTLADGQTSSTIAAPSAIHRVETMRGPASSYWGNGSGGVVFLSSRPRATAPALSLSNTIGSFGYRKSYLDFNTQLNDRRLTGYASYQYSDGYRDHNSSEIIHLGSQIDILATERNLVTAKGAWLAKPEAQHPGSINRDVFTNQPKNARSSFVDSDAGEKAYQGQFGLEWQHHRQQVDLESTVYGIRRLLQNRLPFGYINLERWAGGWRSAAHYSQNNVKVSGGWDLRFQRDNRLERPNEGGNPGEAILLDQLETVWNAAAFTQVGYRYDNWRFNGSLRYDKLYFEADDYRSSMSSTDASGNRQFSAWSPQLGVRGNFGIIDVFASTGTAFQSPTTTELVNNPEQQGGFNPNLEPQRTWGSEIGIQARPESLPLNAELVYFFIDVEDFLLPYQLQDDGATFYRNAGNTRHQGVEASLRWRVVEELYLIGAYTFTRATFEDFPALDIEGNRVPGVPVHLLDLTADFRQNGWRLMGNLHASSDYYVDNANSAKAQSYTTVSFSLSKKIGFGEETAWAIRPYVEMNNVFDVSYSGSVIINAFGGRYYEPGHPRNWKAGLRLLWDE